MKKTTKIPQNIIKTEYAVRGQLATKAQNYKESLARGDKLPFDEIQQLNIGNPQAIGQKPLTYIRDVISLCTNPTLFKHGGIFNPGHLKLAQEYYMGITLNKGCMGDDFNTQPNQGGLGSYSGSAGNTYLRKKCEEWISKRDGYDAQPSSVFLSNGASAGGKNLFTMFAEKDWGIMGPIPVYPFYSGMAALTSGTYCGQYLDEAHSWKIDINEIERAYKHHTDNGVNIKCLTVINPGNPTGNVASQEDIRDVLLFCKANDLTLLADEVYQDNIYTEKKFVSARSVAFKENIHIPLASMHSTSKGFQGECGMRGGLLHFENFDPEWVAQFNKLVSISLCSNITGQLAMSLVCNPPTDIAECKDLYTQERNDLLASLKKKSFKIYEVFNELDGIQPQVPEGSLYLFPRIEFTDKFLNKCSSEGVAADLKFCEFILDETGICIINGSGFDQVPGTYHFRITNLLHDSKLDKAMDKFKIAYKKFREMY